MVAIQRKKFQVNNTIIVALMAMIIIPILLTTIIIKSSSPSSYAAHPYSSSVTTTTNPNDCLSRLGLARGIKLYSQNEEDGALLQTLRCMGGHGTKEYFEFGSETGIEVNTRLLRELYGWHGHLLDGGNEDPSIPLHKEFFTPTNIVSLLQKYKVSKELDLLSIDCDYDDFYITREILLAGYRPRILVNEYNINFGNDWAVSTIAKPVGQETEYGWKGDCYFGVSAKAIILLAKQFGYVPVFSNYVNIIFVQLDDALGRNMIIPSVDNFPPPMAKALHNSCSGQIWKNIDEYTVMKKATDSSISHEQFANSFSDIKLESKDYREWRVFHEAK